MYTYLFHRIKFFFLNSVQVVCGPVVDPESNLVSDEETADVDDGRFDINYPESSSTHQIKASVHKVNRQSTDQVAAQLILTLQERYTTPQAAVNFVVASMNDMVSRVSISLQESVIQGLEDSKLCCCIHE